MTRPQVWLAIVDEHPMKVEIMVEFPNREAAPLTPDGARNLVTLLNEYIDLKTAGKDIHEELGWAGVHLSTLTIAEAHLTADQLLLLASIADAGA